MAKEWDELANECSAVTDPSSRIWKYNVVTGPVGALLGSLDVAGDRADYDDYDLRAQYAKSFAEAGLA